MDGTHKLPDAVGSEVFQRKINKSFVAIIVDRDALSDALLGGDGSEIRGCSLDRSYVGKFDGGQRQEVLHTVH